MKWIRIDEKKPTPCDDIIFSDGEWAWYGWLETYLPEEELSFYSPTEKGCIEGVKYWFEIPPIPCD